MLIVDGQIHLWGKGTPSPPHRQEPYSAEQAIAAMDEEGIARALVHPVLWDLDSNKLAVDAVRKCPNRFAIMGWFYLDDPKGRDVRAAGGGLRERFCLIVGWAGLPGRRFRPRGRTHQRPIYGDDPGSKFYAHLSDRFAPLTASSSAPDPRSTTAAAAARSASACRCPICRR